MKLSLKIFLFIIFLFNIVPVYAYNLNINYDFDTQLQIYQISQKSEITDNFKNCEINFELKEKTIENLSKYIKPEFKYSENYIVNKNCTIDLEEGWYFITGNDYKYRQYTYKMTPTLIYIKNELNITPKYETIENKRLLFSAYITWDDENYEDRPESITIQIYENDKLIEEVVLSSKNNWKYEWLGSPLSKWNVKQKDLPNIYSSSDALDKNTFILSNVLRLPQETPDKIIQTGGITTPIYYCIVFMLICFILCLLTKKMVFFFIGLIFICGIIFHMSYNISSAITSNMEISQVSEKIEPIIEEKVQEKIEENKNLENFYNIPIYEIYPNIEMPTIEIDGLEYIGILTIPNLELNLPILSNCNEDILKTSPCRYNGSIYEDNMIIAGHNYKKHFTYIKDLKIDDIIYFTDVEGNRFYYKLFEKEVIKGTDVEYLNNIDSNLTLFTCTNGGKDRLFLKFEKVKGE